MFNLIYLYVIQIINKMIRHTFIDKCNTIFENSYYNTGLNPVSELNVGDIISRILIHFDLSDIKDEFLNNDNVLPNLKHYLKMTNCGSINQLLNSDNNCNNKTRASSFDIILFKLPFEWDGGKGYDYNTLNSHPIISTDGSNWFQAKNGVEWDEYGVYLNETLNNELFNYRNGEDSLIVGTQHFDYGTENLNIDITNYVNNILLDKEKNYGIGVAFSPSYELTNFNNKYISFFSHQTNTFFLPYIETINSDVILDDRANFYLDTNNRLYFFVSDNGTYINLDEKPKCFVDGVEYIVNHSSKGVYYIELKLNSNDYEPDTIINDVWTNIIFNGQTIDDVELEFVLLPLTKRVSFGNFNPNTTIFTPQISGINDKEILKIGEIRELTVDFIEDYSYGKKIIPNKSEYRLYVKEGNREIDVFNFQQINRKYDTHSFIINTNDLIPNNYHIDIKIYNGRNVKTFENVKEFLVANNVTNIKY